MYIVGKQALRGQLPCPDLARERSAGVPKNKSSGADLGDLADEALEGELADQQLGGLLVLAVTRRRNE